MSVHDDIGKRMKEFYEQIPKTRLMRRIPVAIRIDGKSFHTFTKGFEKPFDKILMESMQDTMKYLCENIQGCVFGYTQSDEITLIITDYKTFESQAFFDYEVQKVCSIAASMATMAFNKFFEKELNEWWENIGGFSKAGLTYKDLDKEKCSDIWNQAKIYYKALEKGAMFDARCFNIPKEEVTNLIYWRQLDATRNSIQMVGQANFSHKELQNKSCNQIQDMLHEQKNINWNDYPTDCKRGAACKKETYLLSVDGKEIERKFDVNGIEIIPDNVSIRTRWVIDKEMPILKGESREYVDKLIEF